jgi:hypothetical protein
MREALVHFREMVRSLILEGYEVKAYEAPRQNGQAQTKMPGMEMQVIKPGAKAGHKGPH